MVSANTLCKKLLNVKGAVVEGAGCYSDQDGVAHIRIKARPDRRHENDCPFCHKRLIYTAITLLNSVLYLCNGVYEDPSGNWHELDRAIILLIGIAAFELCTNLRTYSHYEHNDSYHNGCYAKEIASLVSIFSVNNPKQTAQYKKQPYKKRHLSYVRICLLSLWLSDI